MRIAAWNVNNRVGRTTFRPEAAHAAAALDADVIVLNEFYPGPHEEMFRRDLLEGGWTHQLLSRDTGARANRVLIASRVPLRPLDLPSPAFDLQFPANICAATVSDVDLHLVALRIPAYGNGEAALLSKAWQWLEDSAHQLLDTRAVIVGDLNTSSAATGWRKRPEFERIQSSGWIRPQPANGPSYFGPKGTVAEIDHLLHTRSVHVTDPEFRCRAGEHVLAGEDQALSDHAALVFSVRL
jgi:endonuclease/exonuclease/phosphatase family metal-dependent hydrolase